MDLDRFNDQDMSSFSKIMCQKVIMLQYSDFLLNLLGFWTTKLLKFPGKNVDEFLSNFLLTIF